MLMREAKKVYEQMDNKCFYFPEKGVEILSSKEAYKKYGFLKKFLPSEPKEGYFIYVKESLDKTLATCILLLSPFRKQNLSNFFVIGKGIKAKAIGTCLAKKEAKESEHKARGIIWIREGASRDYTHFHSWNYQNLISTDYLFILERGASLKYHYKVMRTGKRMKIKNVFILKANAEAEIKLAGNSAQNSKIKVEDASFLKGKNSNVMVGIKFVATDTSSITANSKIVAYAKAKGHLNCEGILLGKGKLDFIPEIICKSKDAELTHEAAIGRIAGEKIEYLRTRGLTEEEAVKLIIKGFLEG